MNPRSVLALLLPVMLSFLATPVSTRAGTNDTIASLSLSGSPFAQDFAPLPQQVKVRLVLGRHAHVTIVIETPAGGAVRTLADGARLDAGKHSWTWDGRNDGGQFAADGLYKLNLRASNALGEQTLTRALRKGLPQIFAANPGAIVIAVDPGHGGRYPGACYGGYCEKEFNLDISLKLSALLHRAGVQVVMTRTSDTAVDEPKSDVNGDGYSNGYDDLAARNDIANLARADIDIHNHNNAFGCRCTRGSEIFTSFKQPWSAEGIELATILDREQITALDQFTDATYFPIDRGVSSGSFYYLAPYSVACPTARGAHPECTPPYLPRPSLMPSVLTESLFINDDIEFVMLKRADVRLALAASFYLSIAEYLNLRVLGIGYQLVRSPSASVNAGAALGYRIRVTNRGNSASVGWKFQLHSVPFVPVYDGSTEIGSLLGSVAIPDGLQPGESIALDVAATAPPSPGNWWIKADVKLADDSYASASGVVPLQVQLTTTQP